MTIDKRRCCKNCAFYEKLAGECRKNPPVLIPTPYGEFTADSKWPDVSPYDWCGEYKDD